MSSLSCPLCSVSLSAAALEAHLRYELKLPAFECRLCPQSFCDRHAAERHFKGPLAQHPGQRAQLIQPPEDEAKVARLLELLRLAKGGQDTVKQRLCVCGHCRLLCREDFPPMGGQDEGATANHRKTVNHEPEYETLEPQLASEPEDNCLAVDADLPTAVEEPIDPPSQPRPSQSVSEKTRQDEALVPADVKPSLADLKPHLASDGKVACLQCAKRVDKNNFSSHVQLNHMPGKPYQCLLCPVSRKLRAELSKHARVQHESELNAENHASSLSKDAVKEWVNLCFGETKDVAYKGFRCRPCDKQITCTNVKDHIARLHLNKTIFSCKLCDYHSNTTNKGKIHRHVKNVHKLAPGPETIDASGLKTYEPIIKAMIGQLMDQCKTTGQTSHRYDDDYARYS